ncbi:MULTISPECIES: RGCVC family protein [unclassified Nocardia]|uniref:RGCVC family protein n=1 Tax=unclassified Nocardia TaxID=2637762 RepID=UPI0035DC1C30
MSSNESATSVAADSTEFSCAVCPHDQEAHGRIGLRYCSATLASGLERACACARPADHQDTYYRR